MTRARYKHLIDEENNFVSREDVKIYYPDRFSTPKNLLVGLGSTSDLFGPELEFGRIVANMYDGPTLIVKAAYGGMDLAVDFRPPSRGFSNYTNYEQGVSQDVEEQLIGAESYGKYYNLTMDAVHDAVSMIEAGTVFNGSTTWDLKGLVWFHGWNDHINRRKLDKYEENFKSLIQDLRIDLNGSELPVVIGELCICIG